MIIVDTNIIVYLAMQSEKTPLAVRAFEKDNRWGAPPLWQSEFLSVLALHMRKKIITLEKAGQIMTESKELIQLEYQVAPINILKLIAASKCSAYDCEFVALAQELDVRLLTEDKQILEQFPDRAISLTNFLQE